MTARIVTLLKKYLWQSLQGRFRLIVSSMGIAAVLLTFALRLPHANFAIIPEKSKEQAKPPGDCLIGLKMTSDHATHKLSHRNLTEMTAEPGLEVGPTKIYCWVVKFTPGLEKADNGTKPLDHMISQWEDST